jgi:hypothetical protein
MLRRKMNDLIDRLMEHKDGSTWPYRYRENWHKHPLLSKLLCRLGRHDFEMHDGIYRSVARKPRPSGRG